MAYRKEKVVTLQINSHKRGLAFVIPAFKGRFLAEALTSLAEQTNQDFAIYIGDDASPENLKRIIAPYRDRLNLHYCRFNNNLGGDSLVKHWERCVALSFEPFFCLFADDDLLHRTCVADFYDALDESNETYDVYRFNNAVIDARGELIAYATHPTQPESHTAFLHARLQHKQFSFISSYIFRREAFHREKGFVDFPLAWCSDDASILLFSRLTGIWNISGNPVFWRQSRQNISAPNQNTYLKKIDATVKYLAWIADQSEQGIIQMGSWEPIDYKTLIEGWFFRHLEYSGYHRLSVKMSWLISRTISPYCRSNTATLFCKLHRRVRWRGRLN